MIFLLIFLSGVICAKTSPRNNRLVTIAVVEYHPVLNTSLTPEARISANTENYVNFLKEATRKQTLDMIVFPEATLRNNPTTAVEVKLGDNPCDSPNSTAFMRQLSCAARDSTAYLVVNLVEKEECNGSSPSGNCQKYGHFYYNTDVVFDRRGTIATRYRKHNLFGEHELDKPPSEEVVIETDFGAKYGIFTCFDILFKSPAQDLLEKNVDGVIFPTMWFSDLPFLTALQTQQMWAHAHDVKVFSAGANNPAVGSGGSGLYSGAEGMIIGDIIATGGSQIYIYKYIFGDSPDYNPQEPMPYRDPDELAIQMDHFRLTTDRSIEKFNSTVLDVSKGEVVEEVCDATGTEYQLCCEFAITVSVNRRKMVAGSHYVYRLAAFSGIRSFSGMYNGGIELCAVIACLNSSLSSCGRRYPNYADVEWPITFERIAIKASFEKDENRTQYPNSLLSSIRPINASQTIWEGREVEAGGRTLIERRFALKQPQDRLFTFAIYGRNFARDCPAHRDDNNKSVKAEEVSWILIAVAIILSLFTLRTR